MIHFLILPRLFVFWGSAPSKSLSERLPGDKLLGRVDDSKIQCKKVSVHNLKGVDLTLDPFELIVFTGVSGSGKSSMAFDTLYAEGQRRYIESLSTYARRALGEMRKPELESVSGLSPTVAIEQKSVGKNPRSTVGTLTEIYDYLRVLYARIGIPHCPISGEAVRPQSKERIIHTIKRISEGTKIVILAPFAKAKKGEFKEEFALFVRKGFLRARVDDQMIDLTEEIALDPSLTHDVDLVIDRLKVTPENGSRISEAVISALEIGKGTLLVFDMDRNEETLFSTAAYSPKSNRSYSSLEPQDFSFNTPGSMCPTCHGLAWMDEFDLDAVIDPDLSIAQDCCQIASSYKTVRYGNIYRNLAKLYQFSCDTPWKDLSPEAKQIFLKGTEKKWTQMHFIHPVRGNTWTDYVQWKGVLFEAHKRYSEAKSASYRRKMEQLMTRQLCPDCKGSRLKPYPSACLLGGKTLQMLTSLPIEGLEQFFQELKLKTDEKQIAHELVEETRERLGFLCNVGLGYLSLDRTAPTLSGGEAQRVRLASQVGSGLVGVTYVLDEPSIGLHPRDNERLLQTLQSLRNMGNTVIVVEHDEETIQAADRIVDFGPGPGVEGGTILVNGSYEELLSHPKSLTGAYLSGKLSIPIPKKRRRKSAGQLQLLGATQNNLKEVDLKLPLGKFVAITGVSGSGKSSLIGDTLYPALAKHFHHSLQPVGPHKKLKGLDKIDKVIAIDQTPIGRTPRSNPATYIKLFDEIRNLFAKLPEASARGYDAGRFSFNVRQGSCPTCLGLGMVRIDMDFLADEWMPCSVCKSKRFDPETLSILYKGKSIFDVLTMTVNEAVPFFEAIPAIVRKLKLLQAVGMGYIQIGQSSTTLSGGEAQRIKLAKELVRPASGNTLYILDEPTTGLHFHDIHALLRVLQELVERGNTVCVIEHNMDVVKCADWVIDLGPEGGAAGGEIIAAGTPEELSTKNSPTGLAIKKALFPEKRAQSRRQERKEPAAMLTIEEANQNNLKQVSLSLPRSKISLFTGPSGSGKSSLAFETIYNEGKRRYIESLSAYARQFVKPAPKPKVGRIEGLSPCIAIEQKSPMGSGRSTVGTRTEILDYLRLLYAQAGTPYCPESGEEILPITKEVILDELFQHYENERVEILAPLYLERNERFEDLVTRLSRLGFLRIRLDETLYELDEEIPFDRRRKHEIALLVDRMRITKEGRTRLNEAMETALGFSDKRVIASFKEEERLFHLAFTALKSGQSYPPLTPQSFSFNSPEGMCPDCQGLGVQYGANLLENREVMALSLKGVLTYLWTVPPTTLSPLMEFCEEYGIDPKTPLQELPEKDLQIVLNGAPSKLGNLRWIGLQPLLAKLGKAAHREIRRPLLSLLMEIPCIRCKGTRLKPLAAHVELSGLTLPKLTSLPIDQCITFLENVRLSPKQELLLEEVLQQLKSRLHFLEEVGLGYLCLDRKAPTLSNGEAQRLRLAKQLGSHLTGVLYVLDEPTIGLHPADTMRLNRSLLKLKELGNTLVVVEHDPETMKLADKIVDFGPAAGRKGGHITAQGSLQQIKQDPHSLTGAYLSGKRTIPTPQKRRLGNGTFSIDNATCHNLKNLSCSFLIGAFNAISGVSGSGKSTLLHDVLLPKMKRDVQMRQGPFDRVISVNQNPIGMTSRSDVGSYADLLPHLRTFFASLANAKTLGLQPKHFSPNHRKGMCTHCMGMGYKKVEMLFLPPVRVKCDICNGYRLNPLSLEVEYEGMHFGKLFQITVAEAYEMFDILPKLRRTLKTLIDVGLDYLHLGQEMNSLSGGEAQRIRLSRELGKPSAGSSLYLLDEPTTGLHPTDLEKLMILLHRLVDQGETLVVIEHNLDLLKNADFLIDLGPGAGEDGGTLLAAGTPEEIALNERSITGNFLRPFFGH